MSNPVILSCKKGTMSDSSRSKILVSTSHPEIKYGTKWLRATYQRYTVAIKPITRKSWCTSLIGWDRAKWCGFQILSQRVQVLSVFVILQPQGIWGLNLVSVSTLRVQGLPVTLILAREFIVQSDTLNSSKVPCPQLPHNSLVPHGLQVLGLTT